MSPRRVLVLSFLLAAGVLANALSLSRELGTRPEKASLQQQWTVPMAYVQTLVLARFQPGAPEALALLASTGVRLVGTDGKVLAEMDALYDIAASATGDADADGADEVWIASASDPPYAVDVLGSDLTTKLKIPLQASSLPVRLLPVDLDGDGRSEIVAADDKGSLRAYDRRGKTLWTYGPPRGVSGADAEVRGLDDVRVGKERRVAVAHQSGHVALLDRTGAPVWQKDVGKLRRMRSFDVDGDGSGEVLMGTEAGRYLAQGPTGSPVAEFSLGEAVTEIRPIEADADPSRVEVFLGGKRGAYALLRGGEVLARGVLGDRISSARGVDTDGDGRDEVFVGTENGMLHVLAPDGRRLASEALGGKLESIASAVSPLRDRIVVAAGGSSVVAFRLVRTPGPAWYSPWTAAIAAWLALAVVAIVLLRLRPESVPAAASPPPGPAEVGSRSLEARASRIQEWVSAGKLRAEDAEDRLKQIRKRIAESAKAKRAMPQSPPAPRPRG